MFCFPLIILGGIYGGGFYPNRGSGDVRDISNFIVVYYLQIWKLN